MRHQTSMTEEFAALQTLLAKKGNKRQGEEGPLTHDWDVVGVSPWALLLDHPMK